MEVFRSYWRSSWIWLFPADPMHQFEIKRLLDINIAGFDISFIKFGFIYAYCSNYYIYNNYFCSKKFNIPSRMQSIVELSYEFVADMVQGKCWFSRKELFPLYFYFIYVRTLFEYARNDTIWFYCY